MRRNTRRPRPDPIPRFYRCRCMPPMRSSFWRNSFAPAAPGQPQCACHAAQTEAGKASPPRTGGHAGRNREEMFQERIRIRRDTPEHAIRCIAHRDRNACRTRLDSRQRVRVVVAVNRARRNTLKKRCRSVTSRGAHAMPIRNRARRGRVNTDACACILSVPRTEAIREPIGISASVVDGLKTRERRAMSAPGTTDTQALPPERAFALRYNP